MASLRDAGGIPVGIKKPGVVPPLDDDDGAKLLSLDLYMFISVTG
jgi:hypothetical protein